MIIGVTGGKGGTGKSFFAINLAVALAKKGAKVILLDCDPDSPSDHILLGAERKNKKEVKCLVPVFIKEKCARCGICVKTCQYNALFQMRSPAYGADMQRVHCMYTCLSPWRDSEREQDCRMDL